MALLKNLADISKEEQKIYINSFDEVFFDMDGVIWIFYDTIPGAPECLNNLRKLGKNVRFVTNNDLILAESLLDLLRDKKFEAELNDIVYPIHTTISYLNKLNIKKKVYVIGCQPIKLELKKAGYEVMPDPPTTIEENIAALLEHYDENDRVGAVVVDAEFNITYLKLQKAVWYLKDSDCKFVVTIRDKLSPSPMGPGSPVLVMYHFVEALKSLSGRDYVEVGKPSLTCVNHLKEKYNITDPKKVLFVGDSIQSDMGIGAKAGFQKLLVLSGSEKLENVKNWKYPEEYKPEYYVENLQVLNNIMKSTFEELQTV